MRFIEKKISVLLFKSIIQIIFKALFFALSPRMMDGKVS